MQSRPIAMQGGTWSLALRIAFVAGGFGMAVEYGKWVR